MAEHLAQTEGLVDREQVDELLASAGPDGFMAIINAYRASIERLIDEFCSAIALPNMEVAAQTTHAMKGAAANVGATAMVDRLETIECSLRSAVCPPATITDDLSDLLSRTISVFVECARQGAA